MSQAERFANLLQRVRTGRRRPEHDQRRACGPAGGCAARAVRTSGRRRAGGISLAASGSRDASRRRRPRTTPDNTHSDPPSRFRVRRADRQCSSSRAWLATALLVACSALRAARAATCAATRPTHRSPRSSPGCPRPGGYFDSDNIITNEASYLAVASQLAKTGVHGGVYIGVGPDQNFSYIALIRPSIAFMLDIRRDNLLEHLLFKSLFAMSRNRMEYLCLLFGKPVPADIDAWTGRPIARYPRVSSSSTRTDSAVGRSDAQSVATSASRSSAFRSTRATAQMIDRYRAEFVADGLDTRYSSLGRNNRMDYPIVRPADRSRPIAPATQISYLADEAAFQFVRSMQIDEPHRSRRRQRRRRQGA